jgi:hypothetical protein
VFTLDLRESRLTQFSIRQFLMASNDTLCTP